MMGLGGDDDKMENGSGGGGFFESFKVRAGAPSWSAGLVERSCGWARVAVLEMGSEVGLVALRGTCGWRWGLAEGSCLRLEVWLGLRI